MKLHKTAPERFELETDRMRSNSAVTDRSWLARITGTDPKWALRREFVKRTGVDHYGPLGDGSQTFGPLYNGEVYEYRRIMAPGESAYHYNKTCGGMSGFFQVVDGEIVEWTRQEVLSHAEFLAKTSPKKLNVV